MVKHTLTFYPAGVVPNEKKHGRDFFILIEHEEYGRKIEFGSYLYGMEIGFEPWMFNDGPLDLQERFVAWAPMVLPEGEIT